MRIDLLPSDGSFYKANLHCHSKNYDSAAGLTVAQLKVLYKSHGYNIIAFSEHEKLTYNNELNEEDLLALPAFETGLFDSETRRIFHFNCFPKHDKVKESYENLEYSLENANKRIQSLVNEGYLVVYNHPVSSFHESEEYLGLKGIFAMEIYNNVVEIINRTGWSDVYYDMDMLNDVVRTELHDMIGYYIGTQHGFNLSVGKSSKYFKRYLSSELYTQYAATYSSSDYDDIWIAIYAMCDLFHALALSVAAHFGFIYRQHEEDGMREYLRMVKEEMK